MTNARNALSRRTVLRGIGATMALPLMEAMGQAAPAASAAVTGSQAAPLRMAFVFTPNGVHYPSWKPEGAGRDYQLSQTLKPLEHVRDKVNVLSGLTLDKARANGDGPGDHARSSATFLTGKQARKTAGNDIDLGISIDQFAANQIGSQTKLSSLEIGCELGRRAGSCDSGYSCAYSSHLSWKDEDTPVPKVIDPAAVFESLFGTHDKKAMLDRVSRRRSILDFVAGDAKRLERRLGATDRNKLDEYQTAVREIERRIQHAQTETEANVPPAGTVAPTGIPRQVGEHLDLMYDMLLLAFQTDQTRIASFMTGTGRQQPYVRRNRRHRRPPQPLAPPGRRPVHGRENQKDRPCSTWNTSRVSSRRQRKIQGRRSLAPRQLHDHVRLGHLRRQPTQPRRPARSSWPGAALEPSIPEGTSPTTRETPLCNLYISMLDRMGCDVDSFGDSTGPLSRTRGVT